MTQALFRRSAFAALLAASASAVTFSAYAEDMPAKGGTLRVAIEQMAPAADPVVTTFGTNWTTAANVCEGLFGADANWKPQPVLAESFAYNDDGTELTVKLRKGIKFHSGADMTPADVIASLDRFMNAAGIGASLKGVVASMSALDGDTMVFRLKKPSPVVPALLTGTQAVVMSKASLEGASPTVATKGLDCTGPYVLESYRPDQGATLTRFDGYQPLSIPASANAGTKHAFADKIELVLQPEASVRRDSLITGQIDVATSLPVDFYEAIRGNATTEPVVVANQQSLTIVFNTKEGVAANADLRRAIYYALDMEPIMLASVGNPEFFTLDPSWVPDPESIWHTADGVAEFGKSQSAKVKEYLAKSGYKGETVRFLTAKEQYAKHYLPAVTVQQQLEAYGINVEIVETPIATYIQDRADPKKMDMFASFLPTYVDPVSIAYLNASYPGWWTEAGKMALMDKLATTIDEQQRIEIFREIHKLAYDQFPFIKYGVESGLIGQRKGTWGVPRSPVAGPAFYNVAPPKG
jgi:peptide/nickel transport system substrate-binding protein